MIAVVFFLLAVVSVGVFTRAVQVYAGTSMLLSLAAGSALAFTVTGALLPLTLFLGLPYAVFLVLWTVVVALVGVWVWKRRNALVPFSLRWRTPDIWDVWMALGLLGFTYLFVRASHRWGDWDAWAQWNMHARFMAVDANWRALLTMRFAHPDYPLMQPAIVGASWRALGGMEALTPMLLSLIVGVGIPVVTYAALRERVAKPWAAAAFVVLCADAWSVGQSASQYADALFTFFLLLTVVFLCRSPRSTSAELVLIGLFAAAAAWTKNEGLAFFAVTAVVVLGSMRDRLRDVRFFVLGSLPVLVVALWFKGAYAPPSDLAGAGEGPLVKLFAMHRHAEILSAWGAVLFKAAPFLLPLLTLALVTLRRGPAVRGLCVVGGMGVAYYLTYLLTPLDLDWHLSRSCDRLMQQLFPLVVFVAFRSVGDGRKASPPAHGWTSLLTEA